MRKVLLFQAKLQMLVLLHQGLLLSVPGINSVGERLNWWGSSEYCSIFQKCVQNKITHFSSVTSPASLPSIKWVRYGGLLKNQSKYAVEHLEAQHAKLHTALLKVHWNSEKQETTLTLPWKSLFFRHKVLLSPQPSASSLYVVLFKEN